jgi:hypothetical protein
MLCLVLSILEYFDERFYRAEGNARVQSRCTASCCRTWNLLGGNQVSNILQVSKYYVKQNIPMQYRRFTNPTVGQLVNTFPSLYGTIRLRTLFTKISQLDHILSQKYPVHKHTYFLHDQI